MVKSLNTKVDLTIKATSYLGVTNYGEIIVGNNAFEFYNERNFKDYIQIPWDEIEKVVASVIFKGKWVPRFAIVTKANGNFIFSSRDNKLLLRTINKYIVSDKLVRSLTFFGIIRKAIRKILKL